MFQLTGVLQHVVRISTEVEARFNSVERLLEYIAVRLQLPETATHSLKEQFIQQSISSGKPG